MRAEIDTSEKRRRCVARFYGHRLWGMSGAFTPEDVDFMTTPFTDTERQRASWVDYEVVCGTKAPLNAEHLYLIPRRRPPA